MPTKLIFSDIDGTLLNSDRELSNFTIEIIKKIHKEIPFLLVSARMPKQMVHLQKQINTKNTPMICYNGGLVLAENGKVIHSVEIPLKEVEILLDYNEKLSDKMHISLFYHDKWYVENYDYWAKREENNTKVTPEILSNRKAIELFKDKGVGVHKITCMGEARTIEEAFNYLEEKLGNDLHLYRSKDTYIEIANSKVSKLTGIKHLLSHSYPNIQLEEVMAFGDNYNDVEMIQAVGHGVAVANARKEVLSVANAQTTHHKENGVAVYLNKVFNS